MNWHLVSYADDKFKDEQKFLEKNHSENFNIKSYDRDWLVSTNFYEDNQTLLDEEKGGGWWAWKPYVILDALRNVQENDYILYCDCGDMISPSIKEFVENTLSDDDFCLLLLGGNLNKEYTKRDCFILMECDEDDYWNSNQLEAGVQVWKATEQSIKVVSDWMEFCIDSRIIKDDESVLGENFPSFKSHRNDQSILTNIAIKEGLSVSNHEFRNFIECDYDYWYERYPRSDLGRDIDKFLVSIKDA